MAVLDRFLASFLKGSPDECWLWTRGRGTNGYGYLWVGKGMRSAHRLSWEIHRGPLPKGAHVLHRCDVRACVNPDHLFVGSNADNVHDMDAKRRRVNSPQRGEKHGCAKLTEGNVRSIWVDNRPSRVIAAEYGVDKSTVQRIRNGSNWAHLSLGAAE